MTDVAGSSTAHPARFDLESFAVPPRFDDATFETYQPDAEFPSQAHARQQLQDAVAELNASGERRGLLGRLRKSGEQGWQALYLDGRFGVGKTHLLAAAFHDADVPKAYLSFQELTFAVGALSMQPALDLFGQAKLLCLDEFELDDPGNTMLATSFVRGVLDRGSRLIVTSNTLPGELGRGRFSAEEFQREIGSLAAAFDSIRIDGEDYRHRQYGSESDLPRIVSADHLDDHGEPLAWDELLRTLGTLTPLAYPEYIAGFSTVAIAGLDAIPDQDNALRFVHFIDKLYDRGTPLLISTDCALADIFPPSYGYGGFERKFRRCGSRLYEMLSQPLRSERGRDFADSETDEGGQHGHGHGLSSRYARRAAD